MIVINQEKYQEICFKAADMALTSHLDKMAQSRHYENRISCSMRAGYPGPFHNEGAAFAQWMDECNAIGYSMLNRFLAGEIPQPSSEDIIAALPEMIWP